ncbi:MAG: hypothetical protein WCR12_06830 [Dysgonamonadaceae bacterium]
MKKLFLAFAVLVVSVGVFAQNYITFENSINRYSRRYDDNQIVNLYQNHYGIPQTILFQLFDGYGRNWGNVTLGLEISYLFGVPVFDVLDIYDGGNNGRGWGAVAKRYGIKPGSAEFHRMKAMMSSKNKYWKDVYKDYSRNPDPRIARRNRIIFDNDLYMHGPSSKGLIKIYKEDKKIVREIDKRNKNIQKQYEKNKKK